MERRPRLIARSRSSTLKRAPCQSGRAALCSGAARHAAGIAVRRKRRRDSFIGRAAALTERSVPDRPRWWRPGIFQYLAPGLDVLDHVLHVSTERVLAV